MFYPIYYGIILSISEGVHQNFDSLWGQKHYHSQLSHM